MSPERALTEEAGWYARSLREGAKDDMALQARLVTYRPRFDRNLLCPVCWIKDGARSALRSTPGTDHYDVLVCNYQPCGREFIVPI